MRDIVGEQYLFQVICLHIHADLLELLSEQSASTGMDLMNAKPRRLAAEPDERLLCGKHRRIEIPLRRGKCSGGRERASCNSIRQCRPYNTLFDTLISDA
jgi:hypothetical protein